MADKHQDFLQHLRSTFRTEAQEHWQDILANLVVLEQADEATQKTVIGNLLKRLHTLKGAARAVNLGDMEALCHALENVLSALSARGGKLSAGQFDLLHRAGTLADALMQAPSGRIRNQTIALIRQLDSLAAQMQKGAVTQTQGPETVRRETLSPPQDSLVSDPGGNFGYSAAQENATPSSARPGNERDHVPDAAADPAPVEVIRVQSRHLDAIRRETESLLSVELGLQHHIADLLELADESGDQSRTGKQLQQRCRDLAHTLNRTRRDFQKMRARLMEATLDAALVPVSTALEQLPALVRNLARSQGKEAALRITGASQQIDRRILAIVREAMIHLVTNAVDHGIEPVADRAARGKPAAGNVTVAVGPAGGSQVTMVVADDGAGIDVAALLAAARAEQPNAQDWGALDEQQALRLALRPGVSTRTEVTPVSGRGVGLAVVADKLALVGGELEIDNTAGVGCAFRLTLPVRLATLRGLLVGVAGGNYICPLSGIEGVRAVRDGDIETVAGRETLLVGGRVLPAVRMHLVLRIEPRGDSAGGSGMVAVIARAAGQSFALLVDEVRAEQEFLPKSLGKQLRRVRYVSGAAQLGDGSLALILSLEDVARHALGANLPASRPGAVASAASQQGRVLVVEDSLTSRLLLKHLLEGAGYQVTTAVDGLDALSALRHAGFDAVVSDIEMPRMDGLALTEKVRANPKTAELPVILVTSLQSPAEKERGLQAGADAYLAKGSFDQDNLLATLRRLI